MPKSTPMRYETLQLVFSWRVTIDLEDLAAEFAIQEEIMALSEAYLAWGTELKETSREEGLLEGEERRATAMARTMLQDNLPVEQIVRFTGLTLAQIQQLQGGRTS
jgi:predicted transposase/invertase (TIGR01784 family)